MPEHDDHDPAPRHGGATGFPSPAGRARRLRKEYDSHVRKYLWGGHFWFRSSSAGSTGGADLTTVSKYIQGQERPTRQGPATLASRRALPREFRF
ncbi:transposase [Nonomuraea purpurea]|uniref:Transposase n=1 Tax=Nonomuraea purpurea TaxID=1849276 RepID=A0ABV8FZP4_9ACTN